MIDPALDYSYLFESVLDPMQKTRCKDVFDDNDKMKPAVKKEIIDRFTLWYEQLDEKLFDIVNFKMTGSSTGYQYTDISDIDVQVLVKLHKGVESSQIGRFFKILPNNQPLTGTNHPINYFLTVDSEELDLKYFENRYNITTDTWEKKTEKKDFNVPTVYIQQICRFFTDAFDLLIGRYDRDKQYLEDAYKLDPKKIEISEKERLTEIERCKTQFMSDVDSIWLAWRLLHGFRHDGYNETFPFKLSINYMSDDPRASANELIYKTLDKFGYQEKLMAKSREGSDLIKKYKKEDDKAAKLNENTDFSDLFN